MTSFSCWLYSSILRVWGENVLAADHEDAQSSGLTGDRGSAVTPLRLSPAGLRVSRRRHREFSPGADTKLLLVLQQADSPPRLSVFLPAMSASTLKGWCRRTAAGFLSSSSDNNKSARIPSSSDELQPGSVKVPREAMSPPDRSRRTRPGRLRQSPARCSSGRWVNCWELSGNLKGCLKT